MSSAGFHDRDRELARIGELVEGLRAGRPKWLALLGQRKVGKTSLILEARRRHGADVAFAVIDLVPVGPDVFRTWALRALDAVVGADAGRSFEVAARSDGYAAMVARSDVVLGLPADVRDLVFALPSLPIDAASAARCLELPEILARQAKRPIVAAWDEFQELAIHRARFPFDPIAAMRTAWQRHERVGYVISGSEPTILHDLTTSRRSPFFQHFDVMELGPMADADAIGLVVRASDGQLDEAVARRLVEIVGGQPFYLQILGEELVRDGPPYDDAALKHLLQRTLFSRTGRLGLYFERVHAELVGRSAHAAAVLGALATAPDGMRLADLARAIGAPSGDTARYLERLRDAVHKDRAGSWKIADRSLALWIAWREPAGTAVPMSVIGDDAEKATAAALARMGFDLVYQSRASRGAFDLLATRGAQALGVQVKRRPLPLSFTPAEWRRMEAEAARFGWSWVVAAVADDATVFLDPDRARVRKTVRLGDDAAIDNLLAWLDRRVA